MNNESELTLEQYINRLPQYSIASKEYRKLIKSAIKATNMKRKNFGSMRDLIRLARCISRGNSDA